MQTEEKIIIENRNHGYLTFFVGTLLMGWCAITVTMIYTLIFDNNGRYSFLFTILSILGIVGYFIWNQFLWNIRGKHILTFYSNHLLIEKAGTISIFSKWQVDYNELYRFVTTKSRKSKKVGLMWGFGGETLEGQCTVRNFYMGAGWKNKDSEKLAKKLNRILEEKSIQQDL